MENPFWLRFGESKIFEDTTLGKVRRIMVEYQKSDDIQLVSIYISAMTKSTDCPL